MKNRIIIICLLAGMAAGACVKFKSREEIPAIDAGVIDLENWDFSRDGTLSLNGPWQFAWQTEPADGEAVWDFYEIPGYWNKRTGQGTGYATFRLRLLNVPSPGLGLYLKSTNSAYRLYADGMLLLSCGTPGRSREATIPRRIPRVIPLPGATELELVWQVANFHDLYGGPSNAPRIGLLAAVQTELSSQLALSTFLTGIMLMMAVYHFLLWFGRHEDWGSLHFAFFCLVLGIRYFVMHRFLPLFFPEANFFEIHARIELLSLGFGWFFCHNFLQVLFPACYSRLIYRIFSGITALYLLLVAFTPSSFFIHLLIPYEIFLIAAGGYLAYGLLRAVRRRLQGARVVLGGFLILLGTTIHDVLYFNELVQTPMQLVSFGLITLIFTQAAVLSHRFAAAFRTAAHLSGELQEEVKRQTATISKQNDTLKRLNREKTDFFINIAHEMKTPLTLIDNYLKQYTDRHPAHPDLEVISRYFARMKKNMVNFLDLEKLARGQMIYDHNQVTDFSHLLCLCAPLYRGIAEKGLQQFNCRIAADVYLLADPLAVERILQNLVANALRYTPPEGKIDVSLEKKSGKVVFTVADTGEGIPAENREHIFMPYFQISHKKGNRQGIGMGLNIVKKLCDNLGGEIELESSLGRGTTFRLSFPACEYQGAPISHQGLHPDSLPEVETRSLEIDQPHPTDTPGKNLLLVEDNRELVLYLVKNLSPYFNCYYAFNGREARELLHRIPVPDLIVSDIMMDEMDGFQFFQSLRTGTEFKTIPFIFLTARAEHGDRLKGLAAGAVDYIPKPFDFQELRAKIDSWLRFRENLSAHNLETFETRILQALHKGQAGPPDFSQRCRLFSLTQREEDVVRLLLEGNEDKEIATRLYISYHTTRTHIRHIYEKCRVRNRMELVRRFSE